MSTAASPSEAPTFDPWSTVAVNLAEHGDNPVHTDAGARAAGFEAALVAGTTVHAYLTHPVVVAWGEAWLSGGWSEVRLRAPVFDRDRVLCRQADDGSIEATVDGDRRATLAALAAAPELAAPVGDPLPTMTVDLSAGLGDYGLRAGDDLDLYRTLGVAHPAAWSAIGNSVTKEHFVDGPWVHVRSAITHLRTVAADAIVTVETTVARRFSSRAGDRVVLDLRAHVDGRPVAAVEHESIVRLTSH